MPGNGIFSDKDGTDRTHIRIKWWENPAHMTYKSISVEPIPNLPDQAINPADMSSAHWYQENDKKVFFGHYWLRGEPSLYRNNICCLDYSVARQGKLVAYRLNGEERLDNKNFVYF